MRINDAIDKFLLPPTAVLLVLIAMIILFFYSDVFETPEDINIINKRTCEAEGITILGSELYKSISEANGSLFVEYDNRVLTCFKNNKTNHEKACVTLTTEKKCIGVYVSKKTCRIKEVPCDYQSTSYFLKRLSYLTTRMLGKNERNI